MQARLLSLLPHPLVTAFSIPPSRFPDRAQRARLFVDALQSLVLWWTQTFFDISDSTIGMRTRPWDEVSEVVSKLPRLTRSDFTPGGSLLTGPSKSTKEREKEEEERLERYGEGAGGERLRTVNSLMKKALQQGGVTDLLRKRSHRPSVPGRYLIVVRSDLFCERYLWSDLPGTTFDLVY